MGIINPTKFVGIYYHGIKDGRIVHFGPKDGFEGTFLTDDEIVKLDLDTITVLEKSVTLRDLSTPTTSQIIRGIVLSKRRNYLIDEIVDASDKEI